MVNLQNYDIVHFKDWELEKYFGDEDLINFLISIDAYNDYLDDYAAEYTVHQFVYYYYMSELNTYVHSFKDWLYNGDFGL